MTHGPNMEDYKNSMFKFIWNALQVHLKPENWDVPSVFMTQVRNKRQGYLLDALLILEITA